MQSTAVVVCEWSTEEIHFLCLRSRKASWNVSRAVFQWISRHPLGYKKHQKNSRQKNQKLSISQLVGDKSIKPETEGDYMFSKLRFIPRKIENYQRTLAGEEQGQLSLKDHSHRNINNGGKWRKANEAQKPVKKTPSKSYVRICAGLMVARMKGKEKTEYI